MTRYVVRGFRDDKIDAAHTWAGDDWRDCGQAITACRGAGCQFAVVGFDGGASMPAATSAPCSQRTAQPNSGKAICPIHNVAMNRRTKGDKAWYSHKLANGEWCNQE